jgi:hypothetical protein
MLQRQIVVKALGKQMDVEDPAYRKYAIVDFHSIVWMFIAVIVTIYRTITLSESYENSHYIITTKLWSCI